MEATFSGELAASRTYARAMALVRALGVVGLALGSSACGGAPLPVAGEVAPAASAATARVARTPAKFLGVTGDTVWIAQDGALVTRSAHGDAPYASRQAPPAAVGSDDAFKRFELDASGDLRWREIGSERVVLRDVAAAAVGALDGHDYLCGLARSKTTVTCVDVTRGASGAPLVLASAAPLVRIGMSTDLAAPAPVLELAAVDAEGRLPIWTVAASKSTTGRRGRVAPAPGTVRFEPGEYVDVAAVGTLRCVARRDGEVSCNRREPLVTPGPSVFGAGPMPEVRCVLDHAVRVAVATDHVCALRHDGSVACVGESTAGQLGTGRAIGCRSPIAFGGFHDVVDLVVATGSTCVARAKGDVACAGTGDRSEEPDARGRFGVATLASAGALGLASGGAFTCARRAGEDAMCFAEGLSEPPFAAAPLPGSAGATAIFGGENTVCAAMPGPEVRCWHLVVGASADRTRWSASGVVERGRQVTTMAVSDRVLLAGDARGQVEQIELGDGPTPAVAKATRMTLAGVAEIHFGEARLRSGAAIGFDRAGNTRPLVSSTDVRQLDGKWILKTSGEVWVPDPGGCTLGSMFLHVIDPYRPMNCVPPTPPGPTAGLPGAVAVAATGDGACFLDRAGRVGCRGRNDPRVELVPLAGRAEELSASDGHACARLAGGAVQCWGSLGHARLVAHPASLPHLVEMPR